MSRIRTVKPEFWTSEQIMECSPLARLAFIGMWNFCDDNGVHPASCKTLKAEVFPGDDITTHAVQTLVDELLKHGLIAEFSTEERSWWFVTGWHHQLINRPTKSRYPLPPRHAPLPKAAGPDPDQDETPPETTPIHHGGLTADSRSAHGGLTADSRSAHGGLTADSRSAHGGLTERSLPEGKGKERKGREGKGREREARAPKPTPGPIPSDWQPSQTALDILGQHGIDEAFAKTCIPEFVLYWTERGERRPGWDASFVNSVKRSWNQRPTPRHGWPYPTASKEEIRAEKNQQAIDQWLAQHHQQDALDGECTHVPH